MTAAAPPPSSGRGVGPALLWLREDLRTHDHDALLAACADDRDAGVVALWIREEPTAEGFGPRPLGAAVRWSVHESLARLRDDFDALNIPLVFAHGDARDIVPRLAQGLGASAVHWQRRYAPAARALDAQVKQRLTDQMGDPHSHRGALLLEPWTITTRAGDPYSVFSPFHRAAQETPTPLRCPARRLRRP